MKSLMRTFLAYVEDRPGVLNRVTSLFRRRNYNIESLTVGRTERPGVSRMTLVMEADDDAARRLEANLYKLVNVLWVEDVSGSPTVVRDLALIKIRAEAPQRQTVMQLCETFRARIVDVASSALIVEATGTTEELDSLIEVLRPFGIVEMVRTGAIAMTRGADGSRWAEAGWGPSAATEGPGDDGGGDDDPRGKGGASEGARGHGVVAA